MAVPLDGWLNHYRIKLRGSQVGGKSAAQVNLCEARRIYSGNRKTPRYRALPAAGGERRPRGKKGAELPARSPGCKLGAAPSRLSLCVSPARGSPKSTPTSGGFPPIRGGLTSDPARHKVFQLEAAGGRGRGAPPARSRVGAHSACAGHGPQQGRAREDSLRLQALAGGSPNPVSSALPRVRRPSPPLRAAGN